MSAYRIDAEAFAANAADYVRRAEHAGESFTITRAGEPGAVLAPVRGCMRVADLSRLIAAVPRPSYEEAGAFAAGVPSGASVANGESEPWAR